MIDAACVTSRVEEAMTDTGDNTERAPNGGPSVRKLLLETLVFTVVVVGAVVVAGYLFREPLELVARWLVARLGYGGMFAGIFAADAFTFPLPPDFYLFVSIAGGSSVALTLAVCSLSSVLAGNLAYHIGPYIERVPLLRERLEVFRPRGEYLFREWGIWAVAISALTPVPFSIVSWLAGIFEMRRSHFFVASLFRIPRIIGYYALYYYGWVPSFV